MENGEGKNAKVQSAKKKRQANSPTKSKDKTYSARRSRRRKWLRKDVMSKPYLKSENPNIVVLVQGGLQFRCTKPSKELSFDSTKTPMDILRTLKKTARTMQGVSITNTDLVDGGTITVFITTNETNNTPRYIELHLKGTPAHVVEIVTFMRNYSIDLTNTFDRDINRASK